MPRRSVRSALCVLLLAAALCPAPPAAAREGFGKFTKKATPLNRVSPPVVFLMGSRFDVRVEANDAARDALAQRIRSQLESELINRDSRLAVDRDRPEILIEVDILNNDLGEHWEERLMTQTYRAGTNEKGKPIFKTRQVNVNFKVVSYSFAGAFKVIDAVRGGSLHADTIPYSFKNSFAEGHGAPERFNLESSAVTALVEGVAGRITPSREVMNVLLPKGSLENLGNLADAGQWSRYLEALEKLNPFPTAVDESYRQYALGVTYEAMGYGADEPAMTLRYLEQASLYYGKALEANPGEKYFAQSYDSLFSSKTAPPPLERVQSAIVNYRRLKDFHENYEAQLTAAKSVGGAKDVQSPADPQAMDNDAIIRMARAGLGNEVILKAINEASARRFDTSPQGLIQLAEAKIDKSIILHIQEVSSKKTAAPKAPAKKATQKAPAAKKPGAGHR